MAWTFGGSFGELLRIAGRYLSRGGSVVEVNLADLAEGKMTRRKATLRRFETDKFGTRGMLTLPSGSQFYILEPSPYAKYPCILAGEYLAEGSGHPKHGWCYEIKNVPGRTGILCHPGNFAGDPLYGLKTDTEGCLLPGRAIGEIGDQLAVLSSRDALSAIVAELEKEPFYLAVEWSKGVGPKEA